jgi:hypothetical protein
VARQPTVRSIHFPSYTQDQAVLAYTRRLIGESRLLLEQSSPSTFLGNNRNSSPRTPADPNVSEPGAAKAGEAQGEAMAWRRAIPQG